MTARSALFLGALCFAQGPASSSEPVFPPEFSLDITAIIEPIAPGEGIGYSGIGFDGTNLWLSRWASGRITRISPAGAYIDSFEVPGLTGTRSMTWDGTHFWMANNTATLTRVDPVSRTVVGSINLPSAARYATFDASAASGQGGFWIGNFSDDIRLVNMQGNTLTTLPAANVVFTGRYGIALDPSPTNPALWAYFQGGENLVELGKITLPAGIGDPETFNLFPHLSPSTDSLAGGAFITSDLPGGHTTLLTLCQCAPGNIVLAVRLGDPAIFLDGFEAPGE